MMHLFSSISTSEISYSEQDFFLHRERTLQHKNFLRNHSYHRTKTYYCSWSWYEDRFRSTVLCLHWWDTAPQSYYLAEKYPHSFLPRESNIEKKCDSMSQKLPLWNGALIQQKRCWGISPRSKKKSECLLKIFKKRGLYWGYEQNWGPTTFACPKVG